MKELYDIAGKTEQVKGRATRLLEPSPVTRNSNPKEGPTDAPGEVEEKLDHAQDRVEETIEEQRTRLKRQSTRRRMRCVGGNPPSRVDVASATALSHGDPSSRSLGAFDSIPTGWELRVSAYG